MFMYRFGKLRQVDGSERESLLLRPRLQMVHVTVCTEMHAQHFQLGTFSVVEFPEYAPGVPWTVLTKVVDFC